MQSIRQVIEAVSGKLHLAFRLASARLAAQVSVPTFCCYHNLQLARHLHIVIASLALLINVFHLIASA